MKSVVCLLNSNNDKNKKKRLGCLDVDEAQLKQIAFARRTTCVPTGSKKGIEVSNREKEST